MTTRSYPAVGENGFLEDDYLETFGARDGILEDYLGTAFSMTLLNATNEAQFTAAKIGVSGFTLVVPEGERVSLPAPTSGSKTYYIGALYDPLLNVADAAGNASEQGPCRLMAYDTTIDTTNDKRFLVLWAVTRTTGALTGATVRDARRWASDICLDQPLGIPASGNEGNSYPRGTFRLAGNQIYVRTLNASGVLAWVDPLSSGALPFPAPSALVSRDGAPSSPQYFRYAGNMIKCRGTLRRSSGANLSTGNDVGLGTFPPGARPAFVERFLCKVTGNGNFAEVRVGGDGIVLMTDPEFPCTWIDLSPIHFRAEN